MRRYHPAYREEEDDEDLQRLGVRRAPSSSRRTPRQRWRCKRPPLLFLMLWAGFVFLLTINFFTLSRDKQPDGARYIGWQEFTSIGSDHSHSLDDQSAAQLQGSSHSSGDGPAYPLDIYAPLVPNPAPLTEVTIQDCSPFRLGACRPPSTPEEDSLLGKWVLVPRPLDSEAAESQTWKTGGLDTILGQLWGALDTRYLFYRRSRRLNVPRVVDLRLVETGQDPPNGGSEAGWYRVKNDMRSPYMRLWGGRKGLHLYYKVDRMSGRGTAVDSRDSGLDPITELDVMYGAGNLPWPDFYVVGEIMPGVFPMGHSATFLIARRKPSPSVPIEAHPKFHTDGTYKILQLADLHYGVEEMPCRDVAWEATDRPCHSVNDTMSLIGRWLDEEKPDLVVFTGDQLNGQSTSWDPKSVTPKIFQPVIQRKIPWAAILGNHDSQSGPLSRREVQLLFTRLPYSLARVGPAELHDGVGAGNYYIQLQSPTPDRTNVFNLYFLDSGDVEKKVDWGIKKTYDSIRKDQIDWFLKQSNKMKKILRPYKPDGGVDLPAQNWSLKRAEVPRASSSSPSSSSSSPTWDAHSSQGKTLRKPNAITFVHIPLPEFFDGDASTVKFGSERMEVAGVKGAQGERGFFDALLGQGVYGDRDVRLVVSGHMHNDADCQRIEKDGQQIWTCFGGGSSYAGYGLDGFSRRCRVFQLSNFGETADSWNRFENGSKVLQGQLWDDLSQA